MSEPSGAAKEATAATSNSVCNASEIPCVPDNPKRCECYRVSLAMDAYDGARVAEVMKPSAEGQDFVSEVLLTCLGMDKTPDEAPEVIAHVFSRRIAEARAQERERCLAVLIAERDEWAEVPAYETSRQTVLNQIDASIRAIRALSAEPQEGDR